MFLERVGIECAAGQEAAFEAALCEVRQRVFMSPGFRGFTVAQGLEDPSAYVVEVSWESREELAEFTRSRFDRCWEPVWPFLAGRLAVDYFVERPGLALRGPGVVTDLAWLAH
jgi:heme-degrading monooxygenase HmoA